MLYANTMNHFINKTYWIAMLSLIRFHVTFVQFCLLLHIFLYMMCTLIDITYGTKKLHLFETRVGGWFFIGTMSRQRLDSPSCSCHLPLVFQPPLATHLREYKKTPRNCGGFRDTLWSTTMIGGSRPPSICSFSHTDYSAVQTGIIVV